MKPSSTEDRPVVIGGGVAGIAAAVRLAEAGAAPILVESRPYIGGRVRSFLHEGTGDEIDNGQHLMMGCYLATFDLLSRLGTRHLIELQRSLHVEFRDPSGRATRLSTTPTLPAPLDLLAGMLRLQGMTLRDRLRLARVGIDARISGSRPGETVRAYLDRLGQSRAAQERLWEPLVIATLNTPPESASAALFVEVMRRAFLGGGDASKLALPKAGLSRLFAPAEELIAARGGSVLTGAQVVSITRDDDRFTVRLKEREPITAGRIVLAIPPGALRALGMRGGVAPLPPDLLASITYSPIVSLYLWYDRNPSSLPAFAALLGTATQWMFNRRAIDGSANARYPGLVSCTISAAFSEAAADAGAVISRADAELRAAFPEMAGARLLDAIAIKEKQATFLATPEIDALRPGAATTIPGLVLAGDWTATGLPATIEGAVMSGYRAADLLLKR